MKFQYSRQKAVLFVVALLASLNSGLAVSENPEKTSTEFAGTWALASQSGEDAAARLEGKPGGRSFGGGSGGEGRGGGVVAADLPLELLADVSLITVEDDGTTIRVTFPSGRKRMFVTDGKEHPMDEADGYVLVTAKRKGDRNQQLVISSKWSNGRKVKETWEVFSNPRRLVLNGTVQGRQPLNYGRTYEPAPPQAPRVATATPAPRPEFPSAVAPASPPASAVAPAGFSACSVRPPKETRPADLARLAKISQSEAQSRAVASVAPQRVRSTILSDAEVEQGCLVWLVDLHLEGKKGVQEVFVDAGDGKILSSTFESTEGSGTQPSQP